MSIFLWLNLAYFSDHVVTVPTVWSWIKPLRVGAKLCVKLLIVAEWVFDSCNSYPPSRSQRVFTRIKSFTNGVTSLKVSSVCSISISEGKFFFTMVVIKLNIYQFHSRAVFWWLPCQPKINSKNNNGNKIYTKIPNVVWSDELFNASCFYTCFPFPTAVLLLASVTDRGRCLSLFSWLWYITSCSPTTSICIVLCSCTEDFHLVSLCQW